MTENQATQEKIEQLQIFEKSLTNLLIQRQQFQGQLLEIESALEEIESTPEVYKIIGNIMVKGEKDKVKNDLESKCETIKIRIKNLEKQETDIKEKAKKLQSKVIEEMKQKEKGEKNG